MSKRIGNEAKTINLFLSLSEEGRRIVLDVLKSQSTTPRKAATKKPSASPAAQKEPTADKEPLCGACGNVEDYQDHFKPSPNYHKFDPPKSVARAPRKSSKKIEVASSTQSSEIVKEDVGVAALAASGGGSGD